MLCNIAGLNLAKKPKKKVSWDHPSSVVHWWVLVGASRKIRRELLFNMSKAWMTYLRPKSVVVNIVELWYSHPVFTLFFGPYHFLQ
jgi:hypothetical protein